MGVTLPVDRVQKWDNNLRTAENRKENMGREVVKKGYLHKRGEYVKTWRKRYFILFSDGDFSGFRTMESVEAESGEKQNNFTVEGCQIIKKNRPKPFTFIIRGLQLTSVVERMFSVDSEPERQSWIEAIEAVKEGLAATSAGGSQAKSENPLQDYELLKVLWSRDCISLGISPQEWDCVQGLEAGELVVGQRRSHQGGGHGPGEGRSPGGRHNSNVLRHSRVPRSRAAPGGGLRRLRGLVGAWLRHVRDDDWQAAVLQQGPDQALQRHHERQAPSS